MDEGMTMLNKNACIYYPAPIANKMYNHIQNYTTVFTRIRNIIRDGFTLCGRNYKLLGYSANQLRDWSAWFFAEVENGPTYSEIRSWMGRFNDKNIASVLLGWASASEPRMLRWRFQGVLLIDSILMQRGMGMFSLMGLGWYLRISLLKLQKDCNL